MLEVETTLSALFLVAIAAWVEGAGWTVGVEVREGVDTGADAREVLGVLAAGAGALGRLGPKTYSSQPLGGSG